MKAMTSHEVKVCMLCWGQSGEHIHTQPERSIEGKVCLKAGSSLVNNDAGQEERLGSVTRYRDSPTVDKVATGNEIWEQCETRQAKPGRCEAEPHDTP